MSENYFEDLEKIRKAFPDLTFNNNGYENIPVKTVEHNRIAFNMVEKLLKECVHGFVRFQNFKPRKDGSFVIRCQTKWDQSFTGVSYFPLENFTPGHPSWTPREN